MLELVAKIFSQETMLYFASDLMEAALKKAVESASRRREIQALALILLARTSRLVEEMQVE
jgi:hypothetical protein